MQRYVSLARAILVLTSALLPVGSSAEPQWIWTAKEAKANERVTLRKEFQIPAEIKSATLLFTCDNGATARINGKAAGNCEDWNTPVRGNVKALLRSGRNELVLEAKNDDGVAAALAVLTITLTSGEKLTVETNADWQGAVSGGAEFRPAVAIAKYGAEPWGDVLSAASRTKKSVAATDPAALQVPAGFKVELLYTVPKNEQGSWVAMTVDRKGRLITSDQHGGLYRVTAPLAGSANAAAETKVEPLKTEVGGAHGLLYAFDSLYVMVNEKEGRGLWRLRDLDGDDQFEKAEFLRKCDGSGEHGPHAIVPGPDGKSIFFANGNHTKLPENMERSRAARVWGEDHILPRMWDANGHAKGVLAPGGHICKTDPEGKTVELYTYGFRNQYDLAFDANGELFTFDSDMEWDIGAPWYRPTRVAHCTSGGDHGWRSGSGKWPVYYPDNLPPTLDVGPGSPTGVVFGSGAKFPARYQRAFYACDWTYGTMYAIHLTPDGASFKAVKEEFVAGKPLPLSDVIINPVDGAMYFLIGGRKTQSALYRVTYTGAESTAAAPALPITPEAQLRRELERLHEEGTGPEAVEKAWPFLSHADRLVRWAARVAIERQPPSAWAERALTEKNKQAAIEALVALARVGDKSLQPRLLTAAQQLDFATISPDLQLPLLRVWQLALIRMGKPAPEDARTLAAALEPHYPNRDSLVTRELAQILIFLDSPTVVAKTVPLLSTAPDDHVDIANDLLLERNSGYAAAARAMQMSRPNRQQISLAFALRNAAAGWTPELRKSFFGWFPRTRSWKGGNSFSKFIENIRTEALVNFAPETERATLDAMSKKATPAAPLANVVMPKGPGKAYTTDEVVALAKDNLHGRNFANGKAMYNATMCAMCHKFAGEGGNIGPDLTGSANRYTIRDLAENIIDPSKVISDQYGSEQLELKDGSAVVGRVIVEENEKLFVMTSPFAPDDHLAVNAADVKKRSAYPVSMMPPGLINTLNKDELLDLVAYLLSGGNQNDKAFRAAGVASPAPNQ